MRSLLALLCVTYSLLVSCFCETASADTIKVGDGHSSLVFYSPQNEIIREVHGLNPVSGCFSDPEGAVIFSSLGRNEILRLDSNGNLSSLFKLPSQPGTVKKNQQGEYLVVAGSKVLLLNPDGTVKNSITSEFVVDADFHPAGGVFVIISTWSGSLIHYDWSGKILWRSTHVRDDPNYLGPLYGIDSKDSNSHLVSDGSYTYEISRDYKITRKHNLRAIPGGSSVRFGPDGKIFLFSPPEMSTALINSDGSISGYTLNMDVTCGDIRNDGSFFLTFNPREPGSWKGRSFYGDYVTRKPELTLSSLAGVIILTIISSLALTYLTRRFLAGINWPRLNDLTANNNFRKQSKLFSSGFLAHPICQFVIFIIALALFVGACAVFLKAAKESTTREYLSSTLSFVSGGFLTALSLGLLNILARSPRDFTFFGLPALGSRFDNRVWWPLVVLGIACGGTCSYLHQTTGDTKLVVALWFAAQVLFLGSFKSKEITPNNQDRFISRRLLPALLSLSAVTFFWQIGFYPDLLHHDHGIIGQSALKVLLGDWSPFFILDPNTNTMMRPWLLPMSATLYLFGYDYWVLRITAALWGIALVYATYLFGSAIGSKRLGIIAAAFAASHHILLVYIRQPYVTESTAPFMFCMYFLVSALKNSSLRNWAWCGAWAAWSMLSIRQCTTFPFIWIALFICSSLLFFKAIWRNKLGLLVMLTSIAIIAGPFILTILSAPSGGALMDRLSQTSILFGTNLKLNPDLNVWAYQFGRSFGGFFFFSDESHWGISTGSPIFLPFSAAAFITGVAYLLLRPLRSATPFILIPIIVSITLGSAMIMSPPSYYHFFVGIVMALVAAAIPLERLWSTASSSTSKLISYPTKALVIACVVLFMVESFSPFWRNTHRPNASKDPSLAAWGPNIYSVMGRWVGDHRDSRFYIVKQPRGGFSATDGIFHFLGFYSDISDIMYDLDSEIPLKPNDSISEVQIVVLPQRAEVIPGLKIVYPNGKWSKLGYGMEEKLEFLEVITLNKQDIEEAYNAKRAPPAVAGGSSFRLHKTL